MPPCVDWVSNRTEAGGKLTPSGPVSVSEPPPDGVGGDGGRSVEKLM